MSRFPLRVRFSLVVVAIVASLIGVLLGPGPGFGGRQGQVTFWFALSGILLATLLVDRAAWVLIYQRLAHMRETMQRAAAGQRNVRVSIDGLDEIGVIARGGRSVAAARSR